jgi:Cft2 family RNA processing exonuclease
VHPCKQTSLKSQLSVCVQTILAGAAAAPAGAAFYCAVIVESTYGTQLHGPRETRERLFTESIARTVRAGGRVLLPIVAIGRAQVRTRCSKHA